jgi:Leucine-rich repeat (LRR) protein
MVEEGPFGPQLVVTGAWEPRLAEFMQTESIRGVVLNYARGWRDASLEFLRTMPFLEAVQIIHWELHDDLSPLESLPNLRSLRLACNSAYRLDFAHLRKLEICSISWDQASDSVFGCSGLQVLYLKDFPGTATDQFSVLANLRELVLTDAAVSSLEGLARLASLERLSLQGLRQLQSLSGLERLTNLLELEISECPAVTCLDQAGSLVLLNKLILSDDGPIESLVPLEGLAALDWLVFPGTTEVLDGDLSVLLRLPSLRTVAFKDRANYTHTRKQIQGELKSRRR